MRHIFKTAGVLILLALGLSSAFGQASETAVSPEDIDAAFLAVRTYEAGADNGALVALENLIRQTRAQPVARARLRHGLVALLGSDATPDCQKFACRQLWILGAAEALPQLEAMLADESTVDMACYALGRDPSPAVDEALRRALSQAHGKALVAVVNLLGDRGDTASVEPLANLVGHEDEPVVEAALAALGAIGGPVAAEALRDARTNENAALRLSATHAYLRCAESLAVEDATVVYCELVKPGEPVPVQKAAWRALARTNADTTFEMIEAVRIFDGKGFDGWEGNLEWFRVEDGAVVGGSLDKRIPRNEFLCTTVTYGDFELRLKVKLAGRNANAGIQIRSSRIPDHHEVSGYQADMGQQYWAALYDESRRNKVLASPDPEELAKVLDPDGWNDYVIRCVGNRIQLWLNGYPSVDYAEPDASIEQTGIIGLQIHGGAPSEAWYKDITIKPVP